MKLAEHAQVLGATSACTLCMASAVKYCGQAIEDCVGNEFIYGDSWFAGRATAEALHKNVIEFTGIVKTSHSRFPKRELESLMKEWPGGTSLVMKRVASTQHPDGVMMPPLYAM